MATMKSREEVLAEDRKLKANIEKKHGKTTEQLYEEREKRWRDAVELRVPDRVPVSMSGGYFSLKYVGLPLSTAYYDPAAHKEAIKKTIVEFEPDLYNAGTRTEDGHVLEALGPTFTKWPGGNLPPDVGHQAIEQEYMKADEYDLFLSDPTDFTLRYLLPRAFEALAPLSKLPSLTDRFTGFPGMTPIFTREEFRALARVLLKAGKDQEAYNQAAKGLGDEMVTLGFPTPQGGGGVQGAPFDAISDRYRGMTGAMLDMYRCPDKLLATCDMILKWRIARARPADPKTRGNPKTQGSALHRGSDGFMSIKQFEKFYWPGLKKVVETNVQLGYVATPFFEGIWDQRLEYLLELPKGKVVFHTEKTDLFRAKEIIGNHMCIQGGVPPTLLEVGSPQEVEEHCKKVIKVVGKNGGLILQSGSSIDYAKPANIKAMIEAVNKYGWY